eukprot:gnl/MRDRNA2_/MRDRNA2_79299_c0_seq4.p1 gnl/MRDRNA2_/MRDRNA2_79299_c0~~gnl/MRDRNA2_/MRDRNA2_79299_c0_seq4.p1  ORF type:complete len:132 (+),score=25.34 gnl/MRDRNA2_/MRDRNA2_79299_c0_seq4:94-489(+)
MAQCNAAGGSACGSRTLHISFLQAMSDALPITSSSIDLIVVDPPWGQRHSMHSTVKKLFPRWAKEWARVLRPGGTAIIVTICAQLVSQVFQQMHARAQRNGEKEGYLELQEVVNFNNKGWTMCKLYVAIRR